MTGSVMPDDSGIKIRKESLGAIQLRHRETNEVILVPTPSNDPNDPLNWSLAKKYYIFSLTCLTIFLCNVNLAGPAVAIIEQTLEFFGPDHLLSDISKTSYFFTAAALMLGMSNMFWIAPAIKYGRRPVYISSFLLATACAAWAGAAKSYGSELAARIFLGTASGAPEIISPLTITDIFFLHQRGTVMAIYTCSLTSGVALGIVLSGLISIHNGWRTIYWIFTALNGFVTLLMIFTFPETAFKRLNAIEQAGAAPDDAKAKEVHAEIAQVESRNLHLTIPKKTYFQQLALFSGTHTEESLVLLFFRPCVLLTLPPILWSTLVFAVTTGTNVILSANFATAFQQFYGMNIWQSGLTWIAGFIGCILAIFAGGHISDWIADRFTIRNGGVRHPEMRLPAIVISLILGPLGCVLYGVGIGHHFHWMCPVVGIALATFSTVQATNIALVYCLDSYRPIAGESVVTMSAFKAAFGFLLNFYANHWIVSSGYQNSFGAMAGIIAAVLIVALPLYFWGRRIRRATWQWDFIKQLVHWTEDREVGE